MLANAVNVLLAAFAIGLLILVHEIGHFLAARAVGVRVDVFSIGFWKKIVAFKRGGTEYRLSLIPFGGYVRMAGELAGEGTGAPDEFGSKSPGQRALVFIAGVAMNMLLALVAFILAFTVGVPFRVAEVGILDRDWPAWEAGLREGDRIVRIGGLSDPDFQDVMRMVALGKDDTAALTVRRDAEEFEVQLTSRYDEDLGVRRLGFAPPAETTVTKLFQVGGEDGRCPARESGIELGDRIVAINGQEVHFARDLSRELRKHPPGPIQVTVEREERRLTFDVRTEQMPQYLIGISCVTAEVKSLQGGGLARGIGLRAGDRIVRVNDTPVRSIVDMEDAVKEAYGGVTMTVERQGEQLRLGGEIPDRGTLDEFLFSVKCTDGTELTWVREGGASDQAGLKPGDQLLEVAGEKVESWDDILEAGASAGEEPRVIKWRRGGQVLSAVVSPVDDPRDPIGSIGCVFGHHKLRTRRFGVWGAVKVGAYKTYSTVAEIFLFVQGLARRNVSGKQVGSVIVIAQSSYLAAREGIGKLLYLTAIISASLAFLNILPIPVLDGGHLLFVAIEKVRGKPMSEKVMAISSYVGLTLLLALVAYALANDVMRLVG